MQGQWLGRSGNKMLILELDEIEGLLRGHIQIHRYDGDDQRHWVEALVGYLEFDPKLNLCVRISPKNAAILYALVQENGLENTKVVVTGVSPGGEYEVARGQTSPRGGFPGRSIGVPYYNGSQGYYGSPWTYSPW
jgi:hypothetical protein